MTILEKSRLKASERTATYPHLRDLPVDYCRDVLGVCLTQDQEAIARSLVEPPYKTLVQASTNVGKSFMAGCLINWWYDTHYPSVTLTTAPTMLQLRDALWSSVRTLRKGRPGFSGPRGLRLQSTPDHLAVGFVARDPTAFQGRHSTNVLIVFDEAVGVPSEYWDRALTMLGGECYAFLGLFNPTDVSSRAYVETRTGSYQVLTLSALTHPNIAAEHAGQPAPYPGAVRYITLDEMLRKWCTAVGPEETPAATDIEWPPSSGHWLRPGPAAEALLLGRWPSGQGNGVWSEALFDYACTVLLPEGGNIQVGCDVARFGSDFTVMVAQRNGSVCHHEAHNGWSTSQTAARLKGLVTELAKVSGQDPRLIPVAIDDCGVGGGVTDQADGYCFVPVNAATEAYEPERYPRRRDELWFAVAEAASEGRVSLARLPKELLTELRRQALTPTYRLDMRGRRIVESKDELKKRLGRSCDDLDAVNLAFAALPPQADRVAGRVFVP